MLETSASPAMNDGANRRPKNLRMSPPLGCSPSQQVWRNGRDDPRRCQRVSGCECFALRTDLLAAYCSVCTKGFGGCNGRFEGGFLSLMCQQTDTAPAPVDSPAPLRPSYQTGAALCLAAWGIKIASTDR